MFEVENLYKSSASKLFIPFDRYTYFEIQFRPVWSRFCIVHSCTRVKIMHLAVYSWRDTMKNNRKATIQKNKKNPTNLIKPKGSKKPKDLKKTKEKKTSKILNLLNNESDKLQKTIIKNEKRKEKSANKRIKKSSKNNSSVRPILSVSVFEAKKYVIFWLSVILYFPFASNTFIHSFHAGLCFNLYYAPIPCYQGNDS